MDGCVGESILGGIVGECAALEEAVLVVNASSGRETRVGMAAGNSATFKGSTGVRYNAGVDVISSCTELWLMDCPLLSLLLLLLLMLRSPSVSVSVVAQIVRGSSIAHVTSCRVLFILLHVLLTTSPPPAMLVSSSVLAMYSSSRSVDELLLVSVISRVKSRII